MTMEDRDPTQGPTEASDTAKEAYPPDLERDMELFRTLRSAQHQMDSMSERLAYLNARARGWDEALELLRRGNSAQGNISGLIRATEPSPMRDSALSELVRELSQSIKARVDSIRQERAAQAKSESNSVRSVAEAITRQRRSPEPAPAAMPGVTGVTSGPAQGGL